MTVLCGLAEIRIVMSLLEMGVQLMMLPTRPSDKKKRGGEGVTYASVRFKRRGGGGVEVSVYFIDRRKNDR